MIKYSKILAMFETIFKDQPIFESAEEMLIMIRKELTKRRVHKHKQLPRITRQLKKTIL